MRNKHENDAMIMKKLDEYNQFVMEIEKNMSYLKRFKQISFFIAGMHKTKKRVDIVFVYKITMAIIKIEVEQQMSQKIP